MFNYKIFLVLAVVANSLANPISNEPARCCFAKRYSLKTISTTYVSSPNGTVEAYTMEYQTVYDTESGLWGMRGTSKYGPTVPEYTFWNIHDFKNEIFYSIDPQSNFCVNNTNSPDQGNCLPKMATYVNSTVYNIDGKETLVDTWITGDEYAHFYQNIARDGCIPLGSIYTAKDIQMRSVSNGSDYVADIVDPSIIEIPSSCH